MYTKFNDMYSGGSKKTDYEAIFIELPLEKAVEYFEEAFDLDSNNVTCECCGPDFYIYEVDAPNEKGNILVITKDNL